ncbi:VanZ family protein [Brevibacillus sp. BC25]|uniref:VanZ family protein n=1 Tax=Brevibacillus sp. BC25 TaxID=1144308 RepID=UPI0002711A52|nr:VanZ family protein [Brevibacillus sp. BC25]EJL27654.1 glycopeptide antibiotics resistance protein [Brevibacillus sp. BC25]
MSPYVFPIQYAFLVFMLGCYVLFVPWLIYTYRKDGYFSWWRLILSSSFLFYLLCALFLVLLPLPDTRNTCAMQAENTVYYSLIPFTFVRDILKETSIVWSQPSSYIQLVKKKAFLQAAFNFLLLFPFGVYLRYFFQKREYWKRALGLGFALSLFFEVTQLTGIYGIYLCPYRLFDVDDLILNSSGALFGFFVAPIILALFPSNKSIEAKRASVMESDIVLPVPQLLALLIDCIVVQFISGLFDVFLPLGWLTELISTSLGMVFGFYFIPLLWNGKTIGTAILRFRLVNEDSGKPSAASLFKRFLALYFTWFIMYTSNAISQIERWMESAFYPFLILFTFGVIVVISLVLLIHGLLFLFSRGRRRFYFDYASGLRPSRK